jgi:UDP-N-acetylmuramyl pentapeptide phosphotransferase/UDP-N-acetylglucosamine-1-phosphate transferase
VNASFTGLLVTQLWLVSALAAGCVAILLIHLGGRAPRTAAAAGPQHIHPNTTPRLGGIAVILGSYLAIGIAMVLGYIPTRSILPLMIAALPLQAVAVLEDVTHRVPPLYRLVSAVCAAALAAVFAHGIVVRLDLPLVDPVLVFLPIALPVTCLMVAGACNAFNIIDGTNGLAGGSALLMFVGLAAVGWKVGDAPVVVQSIAMIGAIAGFLAWNYPRGKLFLGDAGAYFIGFMYAQVSLQIVFRNPTVSAWFVIALAAYPIVETLFSIYRRKVHHAGAMQPDSDHLHSLIYRHLLRMTERAPREDRRSELNDHPYSGHERRNPQLRANSQVAPRLWLHGVVCFAVALRFYDETAILFAFTLLYTIYYMLCYRGAERRSVDATTSRASIGPASA